MNFCANCGKKLRAGQFCPGCGKKIIKRGNTPQIGYARNGRAGYSSARKVPRINVKKKVLLYICLPILLAGLITGGVFLFLEHQENQRIAHEAELTANELRQVEEMHNSFIASDNRGVKVSLLEDLAGFQIESADGYDYVRYAIDAAVPLMQNWFYEDYNLYLELHRYSISDIMFELDFIPSEIGKLEEFIHLISRENISGIDSANVIASALDEIAFLEYLEYRVGEINNSLNAFAFASSRDVKRSHFNDFNAIRSDDGRIHDVAAFVAAFDRAGDVIYDWFTYDYSDTYNQLRLYAESVVTQGQATERINELRELLQLITNEDILTAPDNREFTERINLLFSDIANSVNRQPPLVSWMRENTGEIQIEGDDSFVRRIESALDIIRRHPDYYEMVNTYLDVIRPGDETLSYRAGAYVHVYPVPTAGILRNALEASRIWLASVIVHEAYHSKLFWEYYYSYNRWPDSDVYGTGLGHIKVLEVDTDFLREAGAPQHYIQWGRQWMYDYYRRLCEFRRGLCDIDPGADCCRRYHGYYTNWNLLRTYPVQHRDPLPARFRVVPEDAPRRVLRLWR